MDRENQKVTELCNRIHEQSAIIECDQLLTLLDQINQQVESPEKLVISDCVKICDALQDIDRNKLTDITILNHPINQHLLKTLFDMLKKWQRRDLLNEQESRIFAKTTELIKNIIHSENIHHLKMDFFTQLFIDHNPITICIENIAKHGKYINDPNTNHLATLVQALGTLQRIRPRLMDDKNSLKLLDSIVDCLSSQSYIQQLHFTFLSAIANNYFKDYKHFQLVGETTTNYGTSFLLNACPLYFTTYKGEHRQEISFKLTERMLDRYEEIFEKFVPFLANYTDKDFCALHHLMTILVNISNVDSCRAKFNGKSNLISLLIRITNAPNICTTIQSTGDKDNPCNLLVNSTITLLYNLTCETDILQLLNNSENTAKAFLNLIKIARYERIRLQALQIIAVILNDDDIKNLDSTQLNPAAITSEFLSFLHKAIESPTQRYLGVHVYSLLFSLRGLLQHDKMQDEFFKQNGVELVLGCRMKFGGLYLPQALEILATMTFHKEAGKLLKNDTNFMNDVETYIKSYNKNVQNNANAIKLKLVDSDKRGISENTIRYDIMISHAHADKEIAHKLYEQLQNDDFRVWIDSTDMLSSGMESMANAVENSELMLVCMSSKYHSSSYCRMELSYAQQRSQKIVPIRVQHAYHPSGWLGLMVAGLIYFDFSKGDFNENYKKLKTHINKDR